MNKTEKPIPKVYMATRTQRPCLFSYKLVMHNEEENKLLRSSHKTTGIRRSKGVTHISKQTPSLLRWSSLAFCSFSLPPHLRLRPFPTHRLTTLLWTQNQSMISCTLNGVWFFTTPANLPGSAVSYCFPMTLAGKSLVFERSTTDHLLLLDDSSFNFVPPCSDNLQNWTGG